MAKDDLLDTAVDELLDELTEGVEPAERFFVKLVG